MGKAEELKTGWHAKAVRFAYFRLEGDINNWKKIQFTYMQLKWYNKVATKAKGYKYFILLMILGASA